jgi:Arc/MetJ family transcription regulator
MPTTIDRDHDLLAEAQRLTGIRDRMAVVHEGLRLLIQREAARLLARLGAARQIFESDAGVCQAPLQARSLPSGQRRRQEARPLRSAPAPLLQVAASYTAGRGPHHTMLHEQGVRIIARELTAGLAQFPAIGV